MIIMAFFVAKLKFLTHLSFNSAKFLISNLLVDFFNFICLFASSFFYTIEIKLKIIVVILNEAKMTHDK